MKKFNYKSKLLTLLLCAVMALCSIPVSFGKLSASASDLKNAYSTPDTIDIKGSFDNNTSSKPENWTVNSEYNNDKHNDSTSFNGVLDSNLSDWDSNFDNWLNSWCDEWVKNHTYDFGETDLARIKATLKEEIQKGNSPLVPNFVPGETDDFKILALKAGQTFNSYLDPNDESVVQLNKTAREGYVKYTSNDFTLGQYSFYKISFWVKTTNNSFASVSLNGDLDETVFSSIKNYTATTTNYYLYEQTNGSNTIKFWSTTPNTSPTLVYDGVTYNATSNPGEFISSENSSHVITYANKVQTASFDDWKQYSIYISTTTETKISLELALGSELTKSAGEVYFDDVKVEKIQLLDFVNNAITTSTSAVYDNREILDQKNIDSRNYTILEDFEQSNSWTLTNAPIAETDLLIVEESNTTKYTETFPNNNLANVNKVLKVKNHSANNVVLNTENFTLERNRYYRISLWAQSSKSGSRVTIELSTSLYNGTPKTSKDTTSPYISGRDNSNNKNVNNYWVNYIFYVKAPAEASTDAKFNITIPASTTILFDNLVIETVSKQEFADTKNNKLDLTTTLDQVIPNSNFFTYDSVEVDEYSTPLPPANWSSTKLVDVYEYYNSATNDKFTKAFLKEDLTFSADEKTITYDEKTFTKSETSNTFNYVDGDIVKEKIVLAKDKTFTYKATKNAYVNTAYDLEVASNVIAGVIEGNEFSNILTMSASTAEKFTYKSAVINLSSTSSVYIISVDVKTDITASANLRLVDADGNLYASLSNINTFDNGTSEWKTFKFYVGTGLETAKLHFEIEFNENVGTVEITNLKTVKTTTASVLSSKLNKNHDELKNEGIAVVDLSRETFIEHSNKLNSDTKLFDANLYTLVSQEGKTSGIVGILDTTSPNASFASISAKDQDVSPYVLVIKNNDGESTKINALKKFTVQKSKYLQITIVARVDNINAEKAGIIDFKNLNTTFEVNNTEWTEYTLYVDNSSSDKALSIEYALSLLDTKGMLLIDSITVSSPSNLDSAKSEYPDGNTDTVKFATTNASEEDEEKDKENPNADDLQLEKENNTLEIFMAVLSSLLLVAAIVFAILYTRFKAIYKPRKKGQNNKVKETDDGEKGFI